MSTRALGCGRLSSNRPEYQVKSPSARNAAPRRDGRSAQSFPLAVSASCSWTRSAGTLDARYLPARRALALDPVRGRDTDWEPGRHRVRELHVRARLTHTGTVPTPHNPQITALEPAAALQPTWCRHSRFRFGPFRVRVCAYAHTPEIPVCVSCAL